MQQQDHSPRVQRKRDARVERILAEAHAVVLEEGLEALTVHRLAARLDYAPAALYRYFSSKDALVAELERRALTELTETTLRSLAAVDRERPRLKGGMRHLVRLLVIGRVYARLPRTAPGSASLLLQSLADPRRLIADEHYAPVAGAMGPIFELVGTELDAATRAGVLGRGPTMLRTLVLWSGVQSAWFLDKVARGLSKQPEEEVTPAFTHAVLVGFGARAVEVAKAQRLLDSLRLEGAPS